MNLDELAAYREAHATRSIYRQESLRQYTVDSDADNVHRYLAGLDGPSWAQGDDWMDHLVDERERGIRRYRVHVWHSPISDYLRYECEWGYAYTAQAGEEIYILDTAETPRPDGLPDVEFWLYDDSHVVLMRYDEAGRFLDAQELPEGETPRFRRYRDLAMAVAVPFEEWWAHHPETYRVR